MSVYHEQVAAALRAVSIRGQSRYAWLGHEKRPLRTSLHSQLDEDERRRYLVACLREELYLSFYCHGRPVSARWGEPEPDFADPWLAAELSRANTGRGSWEPGWKVQGLRGEEALVTSSRLRTRVPLGDCSAPSGAIRPGAAVSIRLPHESWSGRPVSIRR